MADREIKVLLVDDEEELNEYLSKRLQRAGFHVQTAVSGPEALERARSGDFDVAVVDLKMPGMDGLETQRRLKEILPLLQTVVLTGHGSIKAALESGKRDAFRFLEKPADHDLLVQVIREGAEKRLEERDHRFQEEMDSLTSSGVSPREMVERVEALRKKYGR